MAINNKDSKQAVSRIKAGEKRAFVKRQSRSANNVNEQTVRSAQAAQQTGDFRGITQLSKKMMTDGTYAAAITKRVNNLIRTDFTLQPADAESDLSKAVAEELLAQWQDYVPEKKLSTLLTSFLNVGVAVAFVTWQQTGDGIYSPECIDVLDTEYLRFDQPKQIWEYDTADQGRVEVVPGDGNWILLVNSWMPGYNAGFAASLGLSYVSKAFALKDWADGNAAHIDNIAVIQQVDDPVNDDQQDVDALVDEIQTNKLEKVLYVSKDKTVTFESSINSYDPTAFSTLIDEVNKTYQIAVLGGNLSSDVSSGGSYAAANIHHDGELNFAKADEQFLGTELHNQLMGPWAAANFDAPEEAPWPAWALDEEDVADLQASIDVLTKAMQIAEQAGYEVSNIPELMEKYGIVLKEKPEPVAPTPTTPEAPIEQNQA